MTKLLNCTGAFGGKTTWWEDIEEERRQAAQAAQAAEVQADEAAVAVWWAEMDGLGEVD